MSRIGKQPIAIPDKVQVDSKNGTLDVQGPLGRLTVPCSDQVTVRVEENVVQVSPNAGKDRAFQGLVRSLIANAVEGVTQGFQKQLQIVGVGYRAEIQNQALRISVGLSHPVVLTPPDAIEFAVEGPVTIQGNPVTTVTVKGVDKELVGRIAANIRAIRPPEPYKGKGIKYIDEHIRRKAGKAAATAL